MVADNLSVFILKKSQDAAFMFFDAPSVLGIAIGIAGISIINLDYSKLNRIILLPIPVFYVWIVGLFEGYLWVLEGRLTLSLMALRISA